MPDSSVASYAGLSAYLATFSISGLLIASYPGAQRGAGGGEKRVLVSTAYTCAGSSGNPLPPITFIYARVTLCRQAAHHGRPLVP